MSVRKAQAFIAERSAAVRRLSQSDIDEIERAALARVDRDEIVRDAQAHREQLKRRSSRRRK